jgi:hypothetical protein
MDNPRADTQGRLPELRPVLPAHVTHQPERRCELIQRADHELLRLGHAEIDLRALMPGPRLVVNGWKPNLKSTGEL